MNKKMNGRIIASLMVCFLMGLTMVSAGTMSNELLSFDKDSNEAVLTYDYTVENECLLDKKLVILDSKNNVVGRSGGGVQFCRICWGTSCSNTGSMYTGTFQMDVVVPIISKKQIKNADELSYITGYDSWFATVGLPDVKVNYAKMSLDQLNKELEKIDKRINTTKSKAHELIDKAFSYRADGNFEKFMKIFKKSDDLRSSIYDLDNAKRNIGFYISLK